MARAKRGFKARRRRKKILKEARGFYSSRSRHIRAATETVRRARVYAFKHRKLRKRDFRSLWVTRIGAKAKEHGLSYSQFMGAVLRARIGLNRKILSEMAIHDPEGFRQIVEMARGARSHA